MSERPADSQSHVLALNVLTGNRSQPTYGVLSISQCAPDPRWKSGIRHTTFKRAVLRVPKEKPRYGTRNVDAVKSASDVLDRIAHRLSDAEKLRVLAAVGRLSGQHGSRPNGISAEHGFQPSRISPQPGSHPSGSPGVPIIHQIYGVFRDGKPMPQLFQNSLQKWRNLAKQMGARHRLWCADEVDALMKQKYEDLWPTYVNVSNPVMRVDIARLAILHQFGGMYVDLDVLPNRPTYAQSSLAVQKVIRLDYIQKRKKTRKFYKSYKKTTLWLRKPMSLKWRW